MYQISEIYEDFFGPESDMIHEDIFGQEFDMIWEDIFVPVFAPVINMLCEDNFGFMMISLLYNLT